MEWQYRIRESDPIVREINFLDQQETLQFRVQVRNDATGCQSVLEGVATLKGEEGDLESRDDDSGNAHFVKEFEYSDSKIRLIIAVDLWEAELIWIYEADAKLHQPGCSFGGDGPLMPENAG